MSLQFLGQKSWHPASKANQKRVWVAEQQAKEREEREKEKAKEVRKAAEALQAQQAAAAAGDVVAARRVASQQVNFLYTAPPGLPETKKAAEQTQNEEDEAVREFRRKTERRGEQRKLERYVGRRAEETLTIKDQVERFPVLKDAPVEGKYTESIRVNFNPVGLRLRNVRCIRCGEWGHQSGDRECKLRDQNPNDATRQRWEDPVTEIKKLKQDLVLRRGALPLEMQEGATGEEFEILQSDDDETEDAFLAGLSTKQRKRAMKKLKKQSRNERSSGESDSDSDASSRRHRFKKKKSSKHKHKRKHKHRSRGRSAEEREDESDFRGSSRRRDASLSPRRSKNHTSSRRSRSRSEPKERATRRRSSR